MRGGVAEVAVTLGIIYVSFFQMLCPGECELEMLVGEYGMFVLRPDSEERGGVYLRERLQVGCGGWKGRACRGLRLLW